MNVEDKKNSTASTVIASLSLIFAILFFSGIFQTAPGAWSAMDFSNLCGSFGKMGIFSDGTGKAASSFRGMGGDGARDGFLFAITLFPAVIFALGTVKIVEHFGGLMIAQRLLTPLLRPIMGIPGICGLGLITTLQSTDAAATMTRDLYDNGYLTPRERIIFCAFQFSGGGVITNYFSSGAALFLFLTDVKIATPLALVFIFKFVGANMMRMYLNIVEKRRVSA